MIKLNIIIKERIGKMNQILVSEKLYVTPGMKRKKKLFKIEFILSIFLVCLLSSYYIYAEYDRNKSEQVSYEILANITFKEQEEKLESIVVVLNAAFSEEQMVNIDEEQIPETTEIPSVQVSTAQDGTDYYTIATINMIIATASIASILSPIYPFF